MSPAGATSSSTDSAAPRLNTESADSLFIPNFCDPRMVLAVVLGSELLALIFSLVRPTEFDFALTFSLVRPAEVDFLADLGRISVLMQWLGLTSAALICLFRAKLQRVSTAVATSIVFLLVLANILVLSVATVLAGRWLGGGELLDFFPSEMLPFALRNVCIGLIVTALLLRYFFVSHQWRLHVESEARSRIDALQARIRPHFLFNSMNTIASLTRSDPSQAEEAVEDLADLFRATLSDAGRFLSLKEEFELTRIYQRIEMLRLGDRLRVDWDVAELPMEARLPGLTIQPLLENAIYHGIETLDEGGTVSVRGRSDGGEIEIAVINPTLESAAETGHKGHRIAIDNIRERLRLAFDGRGTLEVEQSAKHYQVTVRFPVT
jgi:two-component system sensor histidine kinase AlgZ